MHFQSRLLCLTAFLAASTPVVTAVAASYNKPPSAAARKFAKNDASLASAASSSPSAAAAASVPSSQAKVCTDLLVDDYNSQSRLTFLGYNSLIQASSDDGTMKSVVVSKNRVTLTPQSNSYFYTQFGCVSATNKYNGLGWLIKAPAGSSFAIEVQTNPSCNVNSPVSVFTTTQQLGWTFDGTERYYTLPFSRLSGIDTGHLTSIVFSTFTKPVSFGPIAFYCGSGSAYPVPQTVQPVEASSTIPATTGPSKFVVDKFKASDSNGLGYWHGGDDPTTYKISGGKITFKTGGNADLSWYTQLSAGGCSDFSANDNSYLHIAYTGSAAFSVAMLQHNPTCNDNIMPNPQTWDDVVAKRYSNSANTDIYIPLKHFNIDRTRAIGIALKGFYTSDATTVSLIEIVPTVPSNFLVPSKLTTAPMIFSCTRPNSFAFGIDDGSPDFAQNLTNTINAAGIKVTFFTVGLPLLDSSNNFSTLYKDMINRGHQVGYHSYTHPPMEGLPDLAAIDAELTLDVAAVQQTLGIKSKYFRPPFGTEGARIRQRLAAVIPNSKFIAWSVDIEDYKWAETSTPQNQLAAFKRDVAKGGNLVVMHYLYASTVGYMQQFIDLAKGTGKQIMRVDQCLEDPEAPPL